MNAHSICVFVSALSVVWVLLTEPKLSFDRVLLLTCSLSALYHYRRSSVVNKDALEPIENRLLRKKIQAINWIIMVNKATYLSNMQKALKKKKSMMRQSSPCDKDPKSNMARVRRWKSWSGESEK